MPDPDDLIPGGPAPVPPTPVRGAYITCDFCACRLVPSTGEVLRMGDRAKGFRDAEETIETQKKEIARVEHELTESKAKVRDLEAPAKRASIW